MKKKFIFSFMISIIIFALIYSGVLDGIFSGSKKSAGFGKNEFIFVILGVDEKDVKDTKGSRTDTIILAKANFKEKTVDLTSIPRDTKVVIDGKDDKLNHAFAYGGVEKTMETIRNFMGIDLQHYILIDYDLLIEMVDAIGGVEIDVPMDMKYSDPTAEPPLDINISKGLQTLDGQQAHDFLRFRSGYKEGDVGRVKAQQMFMKEFMSQALKLRNVPKFIKIYKKNVETNIPFLTTLRGMKLGVSLKEGGLVTDIIPGEGKYIGKRSYFVPYNEKLNDMIIQKYSSFLIR